MRQCISYGIGWSGSDTCCIRTDPSSRVSAPLGGNRWVRLVERHEAPQLSDPDPWDMRNGSDRDHGMQAANPSEPGFERPRELLHVDGLVHAEEDVRAPESLPDLILDDVRASTEHGSKRVRMDDHAPGVCEHIVETALDVRDSSVSRPTCTGLVEEGHLVPDLVTDERQQRVEQIREVHLRRLCATRHCLAVLIDGLDDEEIVGQVHARAAITPTRHDATFGGSPTVGDRCAPDVPRGIPYFREQRLCHRDDPPGRDAQPTGARLGYECG